MSRRLKENVSKISISSMQKSCQDVSACLKALSHPQRLMIMGHLTKGPKTVSELQDLCQLSQSQLSQFLTRMKLEGLVVCERQGRFQAYQIANSEMKRLIESLHEIFCQ